MRSTILMAVFSTALFSAGSLLREAPAKAGRKVNPFSGDAAAIRAGEKLYQRECASCHGLSGEGAGKRPPLAAGLVTG
ncbi:MAG: c-type cytochrome, partial [Acidobacteria bacterium]|nr:c-type cytochrome [Acidobacteriota bacterium]